MTPRHMSQRIDKDNSAKKQHHYWKIKYFYNQMILHREIIADTFKVVS